MHIACNRLLYTVKTAVCSTGRSCSAGGSTAYASVTQGSANGAGRLGHELIVGSASTGKKDGHHPRNPALRTTIREAGRADPECSRAHGRRSEGVCQPVLLPFAVHCMQSSLRT